VNLKLASTIGVISALVSGASLFVVYRLGFEVLGAPIVGTWVMIQTLFIFARLLEAGVGVTLTRAVAIANSETRFASPWVYVAAGTILNVLPVLVIGCLIIYPVLWAMEAIFESAVSRTETLILICLSLPTAVINAFATVVLSVVEGCGQPARRQLATIVSNAVFVIGAYPLLTTLGAIGIGLLYLLAALVLFVLGLVLMSRLKATGPQSVTVRQVVRALWAEHATFSMISVIRLCFEPWTKFLVGVTGGLATAAFFDLALRLTTQVRIGVQAATQPLLSACAREASSAIDKFHNNFATAQRLTFWFNAVSIAAQVAAAAFISYLGLGEVNDEFIAFYCVLAPANAINSMGVVGYYYDVSGGNSRRVFLNQVKMMIVNVILGGLGALAFGAMGAVIGYAISLIYGGVALAESWMRVAHDSWRTVLTRERVAMVSSVIAAISTFLIVRSEGLVPAFYLALAAAAMAVVLFAFNTYLQRRLLLTSLMTSRDE
jgi:O-antigen/teichoic acid export membrane protein